MRNNFFVCVLWIVALIGWTFGSGPVQNEFSEQVETLVGRVKMSADRLQLVPSVLRDLEQVLSERWPGVQVMRFGSTGTGLALAQSDVDAFVRLPNVTAGENIVQQTIKLLEQHPDLFAGLNAPIHMTVPFLTCQHVPTGFHMDVLFNDESPLKDTELIRYLINTDKRVSHLATVVKYWAKVHNITKPKIFPPIVIIFLAIFYLQQVDMLPPVVTLQSHAEPYLDVDGWNLGFNEVAYKPRNESSLYHLLGGFFVYYSDFNFDEYMISVYLGRPVKKVLFKDSQSVPIEYDVYRRNVGQALKSPLMCPRVCIQQTFVHNNKYGETERFDSSVNSSFMTQFKRAALHYRENIEGVFLDRILELE